MQGAWRVWAARSCASQLRVQIRRLSSVMHTSAYVSIRVSSVMLATTTNMRASTGLEDLRTAAYVSICQHTPYVSIRQTTNMRTSTGLEDLLARQPPRMPGVPNSQLSTAHATCTATPSSPCGCTNSLRICSLAHRYARDMRAYAN